MTLKSRAPGSYKIYFIGHPYLLDHSYLGPERNSFISQENMRSVLMGGLEGR